MEAIKSEKLIVEQCLANDRKAQYHVYNSYAKAMYNVCYRMMNDHGLAEDVLQSAFLDVFTKMNQYSFQSTLGAWIKRIVVNACIDQLRKKKIHFTDVDDQIMNIEDIVIEENKINVELIKYAMESLPDGYRTVFSLYAVEGYKHEEIGKMLNISEETSKSQYHRARKKLRNIIEGSNYKIME